MMMMMLMRCLRMAVSASGWRSKLFALFPIRLLRQCGQQKCRTATKHFFSLEWLYGWRGCGRQSKAYG
eukprot:2371057-Amphidinium_carterae.1